MLEVMNFIFSSFWVWAGTVVLVTVVAHGVGVTIESLRGR